jgi:tripartite-type tricarboxylate transporter receptor subunit TctC
VFFLANVVTQIRRSQMNFDASSKRLMSPATLKRALSKISFVAATLGYTGVQALLLTAVSASAQTSYPEKPVRIVAPFSADSAPDVITRVVSQKFSEAWGKQVLVEKYTANHIAGAAGSMAAERVAQSAADGYTLLFCSDAAMTTNVTLYANLAYQPLRDFVPIMNFAEMPNILVVHPSLPVNNVKDLIALAKARPGEVSYASAGSGTSQHLAGALLASRAGVDLSHVPYKNSALAIADVIGARVTMYFGNALTTMPQVQAGRVRAIAVSSAKRIPAAPELPTVAESGYPGFNAVAWFGLLAPAGTPAAIVAKLQLESARVIAMPDVRNKFIEHGSIAVGNTPTEFAAQIKAEIVSKGDPVRASGAKVN